MLRLLQRYSARTSVADLYGEFGEFGLQYRAFLAAASSSSSSSSSSSRGRSGGGGGGGRVSRCVRAVFHHVAVLHISTFHSLHTSLKASNISTTNVQLSYTPCFRKKHPLILLAIS